MSEADPVPVKQVEEQPVAQPENKQEEEKPVIPQPAEQPVEQPAEQQAEKQETKPSVEVAPEPAPECLVDAEPDKPARFVQTSLFGAPVQDIRKAISLGDRFLFQRELFGGKGEIMQQTLDKINTMTTFAEAEQYINDNFGWDKEQSSYELFMNVLRRRFQL